MGHASSSFLSSRLHGTIVFDPSQGHCALADQASEVTGSPPRRVKEQLLGATVGGQVLALPPPEQD